MGRLVVDDEPDVVQFLSRLLCDQGYRVLSAQDGREALEVIHKEITRLILLDLQMPHETGTDLYRKLHNAKELKEIPVIIISGLAGRNVAVSRGVPVLDKPIDEERLLQEIRQAIGEWRSCWVLIAGGRARRQDEQRLGSCRQRRRCRSSLLREQSSWVRSCPW